MTGGDDFDERALREGLGHHAPAPPPPAPDLLAAVGGMQPVRTRSRFGAFWVVLAVGLIVPASSLLTRPLRRDLGGLPPAWVVGAAVVWLSVFVLSLSAALIPRREDVMPAAGRASRVSGAAMVMLFVFALVASVEAPGLSVDPTERGWSLLHACAHCIKFVLPVAAIFLLSGIVMLRRVLPMGARRIGIALGAAGGALAGLALHFQCPIAGTAHVVLAHVGGTLLASLAGALLLPALLDRGRSQSKS
jgi:hypothetical protein